MEELFKDILNVNGVHGIILIDGGGKILFESIKDHRMGVNQRYTNWKKLLDTLVGTREADFVFENGRVYLRQTENGYLFVSMQSFASIAMVKLNCDILLPQINSVKNSRGIKGLFKR
jgi:hypothetical protein